MSAREWARERILVLTALLSVVSLALVFAAALQALPTGSIPRSEPLLTAIPHVNAIVSLLALGTIATGLHAIKHGNVARHRLSMLASFALFSSFLVLYLYRVALLGPSEFPGPDTVRTFVYLPFLAVHIGLAVLCVPFVFYALLSAGTRPISAIYRTNHARVGRIAATLWLVSFSMGIGIYSLLYHIY